MTITERPDRRRGLIAVAVLIGLMVVALVLGLLLRSALLQRAEQARAERRLQAEALAESGIERAAARLAIAGTYPGETWEIKASELGRRDDALVTIRVEAVSGRNDRKRIVVQADYPRPAEIRSRVTRTVSMDLTSLKRPEKGANP